MRLTHTPRPAAKCNSSNLKGSGTDDVWPNPVQKPLCPDTGLPHTLDLNLLKHTPVSSRADAQQASSVQGVLS